MAYTTMAAFRTAVAALEVTGIVAASRLGQAPDTLSMKLPISFPRIREQRGENLTLGGNAGLRVGSLDLVVVVESANLATPAVNLDSACALLDALDTAFRASINALGLDEWTIRAEVEPIGGQTYWTLVATLTASG